MEAYEFLDVEAELCGWLRSVVRVDAATVVPRERPAEFVQVARVGGTAGLVSDSPMVTLFIWGDGWAAAAELAKLVRRRVASLRVLGDCPVYLVREVGGPARAPDIDGSPRYQFTVQIKLRGSRPA